MGLLKGQPYVLILIIVFREVIGKTVNSAENVDVAVLIRCYAGWGRWARSKFAYVHPPWTPWNRRCCGSSLVSNTIHLLKSYPRPSCWYGSLALHYCNSPSASSFSLKPHSHQVLAGFGRRHSSIDGGTILWNSIGAMWSIVTVWTVVNVPHFTVDVVVLHLRVCIYGYIWIIVVRGQVEKY